MTNIKLAKTPLNMLLRDTILAHAGEHLYDMASLQEMIRLREAAEAEVIKFFTDRQLTGSCVAGAVFDAYRVPAAEVDSIELPINTFAELITPFLQRVYVHQPYKRGQQYSIGIGSNPKDTWSIKLPETVILPRLYGWVIQGRRLVVEWDQYKFEGSPLRLSVNFTDIAEPLQAAYDAGLEFNRHRVGLLHTLALFVQQARTVEEVQEVYGLATTALASDAKSDKTKAMVGAVDRDLLKTIAKMTHAAS